MRRARLDVLAESAAQPGFVRAAARFVAELGRARWSSRRASPARCATGRARARAGRTPRRSRRSTAPTATASRPPGWSTRSCSPRARALDARRGARRRGRRLGRHARVRLRLRRLRPAPARRARDARGPLRRRRDGLAARTSAAGSPSRRSAGVHQELLALGAEELELRAGRRPLRGRVARRAPPPRAPPVRGRARRAGSTPGGAVSFHSAGGERAEVELAAARVLELLRDGVAPGDVAVVFRDPSALLVAARAGLRRLRDPVLDRPHAAVRPHRPRPRAARADPRRRPGGHRRGPARLPPHARPAARAGLRGQPRGRGAPRGRPPRRGGARALGARPLAARRARPARAARATRRPSSAELESRLASACSPPPTSAAPPC